MAHLANRRSAALEPGEAHQRCLRELQQAEPNYQAAQIYAALSLEETVRNLTTAIDHLNRSVTVASRRR